MNFYEMLVQTVLTYGLENFYEDILYEIGIIWVCLSILRPLIRWSDDKVRNRPEKFQFKMAEKIFFVLLPLLFVALWGLLATDTLPFSAFGGNGPDATDQHQQIDLMIIGLLFATIFILSFSIYFYVLAPFLVFFVSAGSISIKKAVDRYLVLLPVDQTPIPILRTCMRLMRLPCLIAILSQPFSSVILFDLEFKGERRQSEITQESQPLSGSRQGEPEEELALLFGMTKYDIFGDILKKPALKQGSEKEELKLFLGLNKYDMLRISEALVMVIVLVIMPCLFLMLAVIRPLLFSHRYRFPFPALTRTERHFIFWVLSVICFKGAYQFFMPA